MYAQGRLLKQFYQQLWLWRGNRAGVWVETIFLTLLTLFFCYLTNPTNPLYFHEIFPWPWLIGVIIVLQHGLGPGILAAILIGSEVVYFKDLNHFAMHDFQNYVLSGLLLMLVGAMFSASWQRRTINAEELLIYTNEQLDSLSSSYYTLRLSYDYLEQNIISKPYTLRKVLDDLQKILIKQKGQLTEEICYLFLQILAQYCSLNAVGIYLYQNKKWQVTPLAQIGTMDELDLQDPLIKQTLEQKDINFISLNKLENIQACKYLVAIPMKSINGKLFGLIVIKDMAFWNLNNEILTTMSILTCYFIEEVATFESMPDIFTHYPTCPSDFAKLLKKLILFRKNLQIDSAICAIVVNKSFRRFNIVDNLKRQRRLLDSLWSLEIGDNDVLITLMPFTNATGIQGFFNRIMEYLKEKLGISFNNEDIKIRSMMVYPTETKQLISDFLAFIGENLHEQPPPSLG